MSIYSQISSNKTKTWLIMILFVVFITTVAYIYAKASGFGIGSFVGMALILSGLTSLASYYFGDQFILATSGAQQITKKDNPKFYHTVENLCIGDGLPKPKIYIINDDSPNAFATGRDPNHAIVCVTSGLLARLNNVELEGVIAHELSHIKNFDTRLMAIVVILVGMIALLSDIFMRSMWFRGRDREENNSASGVFLLIGIVLAVLSPIIATLIQLAVSRKRELLADASGVLLTRYPEGLASALEKIANDPRPLQTANSATAHLYIVNPFKGKDVTHWFAGLFDTHPPIEERIKILRSM